MSMALRDRLATLDHGSHLCLVYTSAAEQMRAAVPFIAGGLARGECCTYIVDEHTAAEMRELLGTGGVDVDAEVERGALVIASQRETYLRGGGFDPQAMIEFLRGSEADALARGYTGLRVTGEMTWALGSETSPHELIEYEALLNRYFPTSRALAICQYNRDRFSPEIVRDVLRTHPLVILGEQVCTNLYYEPPELVLDGVGAGQRVDWMIQQLQRARAVEEALEQSNHVLAEANRAKSDFLALMSHELRTPLNAIIGYESLLSNGISGPITEEQRRQLERIRASASHLRHLIDEVLSVSRLDGRSTELALEPVVVADALSDAAAYAEPLATEKGLAFRVELRGDRLAVVADRRKLHQLLAHLLSNAVKFTDHGEVALCARRAGAGVELEVRDTGIGIDAVNHERIFDPFWQVAQGTTRTAGGVGLGLHMARRLARMMGSDITVDSATAAGSVFTLSLPEPVVDGSQTGDDPAPLSVPI
jgi:signal transduction histidine kinase